MRKTFLASVLITISLGLPLIASAETNTLLSENNVETYKEPNKIEFYNQDEDLFTADYEASYAWESSDNNDASLEVVETPEKQKEQSDTSPLDKINTIDSSITNTDTTLDEPSDESDALSESLSPTKIEFIDNEIKTGESTPTDLQPINRSEEVKSKEEFGVIYGDVVIRLGDDPEFAIDEMEKIETEELEVHDDRVTIYTPAYKSYETKNIAVMTNTEDAQETIKAIFIDIKGVKTKRGIEVGDPITKVYKKYGSNYKNVLDTIIYKIKSKGQIHYLLFQINDDNTVLSYAILDELPAVYKKYY